VFLPIENRSFPLFYATLKAIHGAFLPTRLPEEPNSKDIEKYCDEIIRVLNSENELLSKLQICTQRLESSGIDYKNQSQLKQKDTTTALINASKKS
ncbi:MAG: hypothetical protein HW390_3430, partial [Candidatus Brocadiaceae bacterium]|nr:hypothetical protein [Candidatus Brocadiaceae bacterium]